MPAGPWLPIGTKIASGLAIGRTVTIGDDWQIAEDKAGGRVLIARETLAMRWIASGALLDGDLATFSFGTEAFAAIRGGREHMLAPVIGSRSPNGTTEALAFATAIAQTRAVGETASLGDGIYVERLSRILPTYGTEAEPVDDATILGTWLTGGLRVPAAPVSRIQAYLSWMSPEQLGRVVASAGLEVGGLVRIGDDPSPASADRNARGIGGEGRFELPGRRVLETFFNDHIVDVVQNRESYRLLGIGNPAAIVLEGPPGCGKTVAVERLVFFLGWPCHHVDAGSIASPYIHETSRKISTLFREAIDTAPSVIVIDEMDAFLSERDGGSSSQHRVEEIAEFLRRIPDAIKAGVLVIGMTNRIDIIDPAILRRGRFDHVVTVDYADAAEVLDLLGMLTADLPVAPDVPMAELAGRLGGRPLSDAAFVVREAARQAARRRSKRIDADDFGKALETVVSKDRISERGTFGFTAGRDR